MRTLALALLITGMTSSFASAAPPQGQAHMGRYQLQNGRYFDQNGWLNSGSKVTSMYSTLYPSSKGRVSMLMGQEVTHADRVQEYGQRLVGAKQQLANSQGYVTMYKQMAAQLQKDIAVLKAKYVVVPKRPYVYDGKLTSYQNELNESEWRSLPSYQQHDRQREWNNYNSAQQKIGQLSLELTHLTSTLIPLSERSVAEHQQEAQSFQKTVDALNAMTP